MSTLAGMLITVSVMYIMFVMIRETNELTRTRFRLRYFALRDELAMLVAEGKLTEDSWEYKHIIDTLNFHIRSVERLSMTRIVEMLAEYHLSADEERRVKMMRKHVDDKDVANIVVGYMNTTYDLINRNSRAQIYLVRLMARLLANSPMTKKRAGALPVSKVVTPERALSAIRTHKTVFEPILAAT